MGQKTTYGVPRETEADRIAAAERAKEKARIEKAELDASLEAVADEEIRKRVVEEVRKREEKRNGEPVEAVKLATETASILAQRGADKTRLEKLMKEHKRGKQTVYTGMKMAVGALLKDMERSVEAGRIASRLGMTNPIRSSVMGVGDGTGVIQDKMTFVKKFLDKFAQMYRENGGEIDAGYFEGGRQKK